MREQTLRDFFVGAVDAVPLQQDLEGSSVRTSQQVIRQRIVDMAEDFEVHPVHLIRLCDAVLADQLPAAALEPIGFCLGASDRFYWDGDTPDGERVAETVYDWSAPSINFALTAGTVAKFRHRLVTGEDTFTRQDHASRQRRAPEQGVAGDVRPGIVPE